MTSFTLLPTLPNNNNKQIKLNKILITSKSKINTKLNKYQVLYFAKDLRKQVK